MQINVCDRDGCTEYAVVQVQVTNGAEGGLAGWDGTVYDTCLKHYGDPIGKWRRQWAREAREYDRQEAS